MSRDTITADQNATSGAVGDGSAECATQTLAAPGGSCRPSSECRRACSLAHASRYLQFSKKCTLRRDGTCPGGTVVSAKCADRSAFGENPYACTALQELAALSSFLHNEAPWNDTRRTWPTARPGASTWSVRRSAGCSCPRWSAGPARASRAELAADMSAGVGGRADLPEQTSPGPGPEEPKKVRVGKRVRRGAIKP